MANHPPCTLGFRFQAGFSLVHTTLVVVAGLFRMFQDASGSAVNGHDGGTLAERDCLSTITRGPRMTHVHAPRQVEYYDRYPTEGPYKRYSGLALAQ